MSVTQRAGDSITNHAVADVADRADILRRNWLPETGPTGAGIKLGLGGEQRVVAADATKHALLVQVPILSAVGKFGVSVASNVEGGGRELLLPIVFGLNNFCDMDGLQSLAVIGELNDLYLPRLLSGLGRYGCYELWVS